MLAIDYAVLLRRGSEEPALGELSILLTGRHFRRTKGGTGEEERKIEPLEGIRDSLFASLSTWNIGNIKVGETMT